MIVEVASWRAAANRPHPGTLHTGDAQTGESRGHLSVSRLTDSKSALGGVLTERCRDRAALLSFTTTYTNREDRQGSLKVA
jgi:hypothetical protein